MWYESLTGISVSRVDDFAFCDKKFFQEQVIEKLKRILKVNTSENRPIKYLQLEVLQTLKRVKINQDLYIPTITLIS